MANKKLIILSIVVFITIVSAAFILINAPLAVLNPAGIVAQKEKHLIDIALILSAIVVLPVYFLTLFILFKYREGSKSKAKYSPEFDHSKIIETIWWVIPIIIIGILSIITWQSSHALDPYKPLSDNQNPLKVEVISLSWKWLFIYPDQHIASVNNFVIPTGRPLNIYLTSDSVMNSFWIPRLGSQIYTMPGMLTQDHLMSSIEGTFYGSSANISGNGFASMHFNTKSVSKVEFNNWVNTVQNENKDLTLSNYKLLAKPSVINSPINYSDVENNLFNLIIDKYMVPSINEVNG